MSAVRNSRIAANYDGSVHVFPRLREGEKLTVKWRGIRKTWEDAAIMPWLDEAGNPDRDIADLVELHLAWKIALYDNNDQQLAIQMEREYRDKRAQLIADCATDKRMDLLDIGVNECP